MDIEEDSDDWNPDPNLNILDKKVIKFTSTALIQTKKSKQTLKNKKKPSNGLWTTYRKIPLNFQNKLLFTFKRTFTTLNWIIRTKIGSSKTSVILKHRNGQLKGSLLSAMLHSNML